MEYLIENLPQLSKNKIEVYVYNRIGRRVVFVPQIPLMNGLTRIVNDILSLLDIRDLLNGPSLHLIASNGKRDQVRHIARSPSDLSSDNMSISFEFSVRMLFIIYSMASIQFLRRVISLNSRIIDFELKVFLYMCGVYIFVLIVEKWNVSFRSADSSQLIASPNTKPVDPILIPNVNIEDCEFKVLSTFPRDEDSCYSNNCEPWRKVKAVTFLIKIEACSQDNLTSSWQIRVTYDDISILCEHLRILYPTLKVPRVTSTKAIYERSVTSKLKPFESIKKHKSSKKKPDDKSPDYEFNDRLSVDDDDDDKEADDDDDQNDGKSSASGITDFDNYSPDAIVWHHQQIQIMQWLKQIRSMPAFQKDNHIRRLLRLPIRTNPTGNTPYISSFQSILALYKQLHSEENIPLSMNDPTTDEINQPTSNNNTTPTESIFPWTINPSDGTKIYHSNDEYNISWKGENIDEFEFLDLTPAQHALYADCSFSHNYKVRGKGYMRDKKKIEAGHAVGKLLFFEILEVPQGQDRCDHVASRGKVKRRIEILNTLEDKPFLFLLGLQIPGDPNLQSITCHALPSDIKAELDYREQSRLSSHTPYTMNYLNNHTVDHPNNVHSNNPSTWQDREKFTKLVGRFLDIPRTESERYAVWGVDYPYSDNANDDDTTITEELKARREEFERKKKGFNKRKEGLVKGDVSFGSPYEPGSLPLDTFQNRRFKLIPIIVDGPWILQMSVRPTPVILGQKVAQRYFRGENYFEVDVHVGSSSVALQIVGLARGYASAFVANIGVVIQGDSEAELPEKVLTCFTLVNMDLNVRSKM